MIHTIWINGKPTTIPIEWSGVTFSQGISLLENIAELMVAKDFSKMISIFTGEQYTRFEVNETELQQCIAFTNTPVQLPICVTLIQCGKNVLVRVPFTLTIPKTSRLNQIVKDLANAKGLVEGMRSFAFICACWAVEQIDGSLTLKERSNLFPPFRKINCLIFLNYHSR